VLADSVYCREFGQALHCFFSILRDIRSTNQKNIQKKNNLLFGLANRVTQVHTDDFIGVAPAASAVLCSLLTGAGRRCCAELACTAGRLLLTSRQTECCVVALPIAVYMQRTWTPTL